MPEGPAGRRERERREQAAEEKEADGPARPLSHPSFAAASLDRRAQTSKSAARARPVVEEAACRRCCRERERGPCVRRGRKPAAESAAHESKVSASSSMGPGDARDAPVESFDRACRAEASSSVERSGRNRRGSGGASDERSSGWRRTAVDALRGDRRARKEASEPEPRAATVRTHAAESRSSGDGEDGGRSSRALLLLPGEADDAQRRAMLRSDCSSALPRRPDCAEAERGALAEACPAVECAETGTPREGTGREQQGHTASTAASSLRRPSHERSA